MTIMDRFPCLSTIPSLGVLAVSLPGVSALGDEIPIIASTAVALFMLLILITVIVFGAYFAKSWIKSTMKNRGKVKMPRSYFEKKKEAKLRLLAEANRSSRMTRSTYMSQHQAAKPAVANGSVPPAVPVVDKVKQETMVHGWSQESRKVYEEKAYTMELGAEQEDEFHIETSIVDNEVLDVGPFKNMESSSAKPVDGNVYSNPYLYTNNDRVTVTRSSEKTGIVSAISGDEMEDSDMSKSRNNRHSANGAFNIEEELIRV